MTVRVDDRETPVNEKKRWLIRLLALFSVAGVIIVLAPAVFIVDSSDSSSGLPADLSLQIPSFTDSRKIPDSVSLLSDPIIRKIPESPSSSSKESTASNNLLSGVDEQGFLKAWTLQLASYGDEASARDLAETLVKKGYSAYIRTNPLFLGKDVYRVMVGPEVRVHDLEVQKNTLYRETGFSGSVVRYEP
ncbi:hypothetical protein CI610_01235 [invertebrate metagenome]|uniref:SPOR domain-containing protein n=1 Tax=invertebrate metagenome TaxID=1711999 RepID=A0A2H9T9B5_9ZZZZ